MRYLIGAGANVNQLHGVLKDIPLHWAADLGHCECAKALIEAGSKLDLKDRFGNSPLMLAKANEHKDMVKLLEEAAANPSRKRSQFAGREVLE